MILLLLMGLGAASVKAQVRIGGNAAPNPAAALDLNANDDATPAGNKGALALPRVSLASTTAQLNGATPVTGMLVYNTNATLGVGIYFWNGTNWIIISGDGVVGNEMTDTIAGSGLTRAGAGTTSDPYKVGIKTSGIMDGMVHDTTLTFKKLNTFRWYCVVPAGTPANTITHCNIPAGCPDIYASSIQLTGSFRTQYQINSGIDVWVTSGTAAGASQVNILCFK